MLWLHRGVKEATWEREDTVIANYPFLFEVEGRFLIIWSLNDCCICMGFECVCVCEFQGRNYVKGGRM